MFFYRCVLLLSRPLPELEQLSLLLDFVLRRPFSKWAVLGAAPSAIFRNFDSGVLSPSLLFGPVVRSCFDRDLVLDSVVFEFETLKVCHRLEGGVGLNCNVDWRGRFRCASLHSNKPWSSYLSIALMYRVATTTDLPVTFLSRGQ